METAVWKVIKSDNGIQDLTRHHDAEGLEYHFDLCSSMLCHMFVIIKTSATYKYYL